MFSVNWTELASLTDAVSYFLKHANPAGGKRTLEEVAKEFLKSRAAMGVRPRTLTQYESYLRTIGNDSGIGQSAKSAAAKSRSGLLSQIGRNELATTTSVRFRLYSFLPAIMTTAWEILPKKFQERSSTTALLVFSPFSRWRSC